MLRKLDLKNILPLLIICIFFINANAQSDILTEADQMPFFPGCEDSSLTLEDKRACSNKNIIRFISNELVYPPTAKEQGVEGTVYVTFVINEQGKVVNPNLIRDIGGGCGQAALNVVRNMPTWEPGIHQGKNANIKLSLPIYFSLKNDALNEKAQKYQINWGSVSTQVSLSKQDLEEQLAKPLYVRDAYGDEKPLAELSFAFEKKRTFLEESSAGKVTDDLKKIISKCKKGGVFSITAVIQVKGELIFVKRQFEII